jgi:hypothetical protein
LTESIGNLIAQVVPAPPLSASGVTLQATVGATFTGVIATFTTSDATASAGNFQVTINWGDGTPLDTTSSSVTGSGGTFSVSGTHTYAASGSFPIAITIVDLNLTMTSVGGSTATVTSTAKVASAPLAVSGTAITVPHGVLASNVIVATFTDTGGAKPVGSYLATIDWGDHTDATVGTISMTGNMFSVEGNHTYRAPGRYTVQVTVRQNDGSSDLASSSAVIGSANERFVAQAFRDLLGREVDPFGLANFSAALDQGSATTEQVAGAIEVSQEGRTRSVDGLYHDLLGRAVDPVGLANAVLLLNGGGTLAQLQATLTSSPEYFQTRGGGTNDGFLRALFQDVLHRPIDANTQSVLGMELANGVSRYLISLGVFVSTEFRNNLINGYFQQFLNRAADPTGLGAFLTVLQRGGREEQVIASIVGSAEYFGRV